MLRCGKVFFHMSLLFSLFKPEVKQPKQLRKITSCFCIHTHTHTHAHAITHRHCTTLLLHRTKMLKEGRASMGMRWQQIHPNMISKQPLEGKEKTTMNGDLPEFFLIWSTCKSLRELFTLFGPFVNHYGAIYTIAKAGPILSLARAGSRLVHLHLPSGPDLDEKFHIIIAAIASSCLLYFQAKAPCSWRQMAYRWCWVALSSTLEHSQVQLASVSGWLSVNAQFCAKAIFAGVNGPMKT